MRLCTCDCLRLIIPKVNGLVNLFDNRIIFLFSIELLNICTIVKENEKKPSSNAVPQSFSCSPKHRSVLDI